MSDDTRFSVSIDRELSRRLDAVCPWGSKTQIVRCVLELVTELGERHGRVGLALLLDGKLELKAKEGVYLEAGRTSQKR